MRYAAMVVAVLLAGCGVDTMEAAATAGALEQQELEQGERTRADVRERIDAATAGLRERQERMRERASRF